MSQKTIYTENTLDLSTGEIIPKRWITKKVANEEQFARAYIKDIGALAKCSGAEQSVVLCSLQYLDYNTNELALNTGRRQDIATCGGLKISTVDMAISKLYKKNIFIRKDKKIYLNPELFFYGTDLARNTVRELVIRYELEK